MIINYLHCKLVEDNVKAANNTDKTKVAFMIKKLKNL